MRVENNKIVVKIKLIGEKFTTIENALIDTGATFTVIPPEIAEFLELKLYKRKPRIDLITASGLIEVPVKVIPKIIAENIEIDRLNVVIHKIPDPAPIKILLGMNFIEKIELLINGKKKGFDIKDP